MVADGIMVVVADVRVNGKAVGTELRRGHHDATAVQTVSCNVAE
jgi:hypothetical protein